MKRLVSGILLLTLAVLLCACGGAAGPEAAVRTALDGLKEHHLDKVETVLSYEKLMSFSDDVRETFAAPSAAAALFRHLSYEVAATREQADSAEVDVTITNVEFSSFMGDYMTAFMLLYIENEQAQDKLSDADFMAKVGEKLSQMTDEHQTDTVSHTVTVHLFKTGDGWRLEPDEDFADAVFGGLISASAAAGGQE